MEEITQEIREITKLFINVLMNTKLEEKNIPAIVEMLWGDFTKMDNMVAFIKNHPQSTQTEIITKAMEISGRN